MERLLDPSQLSLTPREGPNYCSKKSQNPEKIMNMALRSHSSRDRLRGEIEFGPYLLTGDGELHCPDGARIQLSERLVCVLVELAVKDGGAVSRLDLIEHCWPGDAVAEDNLTRAIADLRKIFRAHGGDCIETVYGFGYRFNTGQSDYDFRKKASFCQEAWQRIYQRQCASLNSAEDLFTQVVKKDETHLKAWLGLAETQFHRMQLCYTTTVDSAPQASLFIDRALDLDPACADALALKGLLLTWADWDFAGAEVFLKRACELEPNAYLPNQATAWHKLATGKFESAENHARVATAARPLSATARAVRVVLSKAASAVWAVAAGWLRFALSGRRGVRRFLQRRLIRSKASRHRGFRPT